MKIASEELHDLFRNALRKDKCFAALPAGRQEELLQKAVQEGTERADKLRAELETPDFEGIRRWLLDDGIRVVKLDTKYQLPYIAEYEEKKKQITLYVRRIAQMQQTLEKLHPEYFEKCPLEEMCLAHECFHHLEKKGNHTTGRLIWSEERLL